MRFAALFLWLAVPLAGYATYAAYGLPHIPWSYTFVANGEPHNPFAERYYTTCTFTGWYGTFTVNAQNGRCGWVHFFKENSQ
jgi:hypothetical protein